MTANSTEPDTGRRLRKIEDALENLQRERRSADTGVDNCPTGMIAGFPAPGGAQGWLPIDGRTISATDFPALHRYLTANGISTTLPDWADYFPVGAGNLYNWASAGGSANAINVAHTHAMTQMRFDSNDTSHLHAGSGVTGAFAEATEHQDGVSSNQPTTTSAGSSGTGANLPPYQGVFWMIRT